MACRKGLKAAKMAVCFVCCGHCIKRGGVRSADSENAKPALDHMSLAVKIHAQIFKIIVDVAVVQVARQAEEIAVIGENIVENRFGIAPGAEIGNVSRDNDKIRRGQTLYVPQGGGGHVNVSKGNYFQYFISVTKAGPFALKVDLT